MDNAKAYVFKTEDYGKSWTAIAGNLPGDTPVHVVREDPNQKGLLVAGTDTGLFYSAKSGEWTALKAGFPTASVFDLQFSGKTHDLIVATHGRGVFVLDNLTPLEQFQSVANEKELRVLPVAPAQRWMGGGGGGFSLGAFTAPNPPTGAVIDYFVGADIAREKMVAAPVRGEQAGANGGGRGATIVITDASGNTVRKMSGPARAGFNREIWPLTYEGPTPLNFNREGEATGGGEGGGRGGAPQVAPGVYHVAVTVGDQTEKQDVRVEADPRVKTDAAVFAAQTKAALEARDLLSELNVLLNRMEATRSQLKSLQRPGSNAAVAGRARELEPKVAAMEEQLYNAAALTDSKAYLHYLARLHDRVSRLGAQFTGNYGEAPSQMSLDELGELTGEVKKQVAAFDQFLATEGASFNKFAAEQGVQAISTGKTAPK